MGAPLGLILLRALQQARLPGVSFAWQELSADPGLYVYVTLATGVVMTLVGYYIGRFEEQLTALSDRDPLTELYNRRGFDARLAQELARARRSRTPLCLVFIDVDRFKAINDRFGHAAGDVALQRVAGVLKQTSRRSDVAARPGGDEFALILPDTTAKAGIVMAERVAQQLRTSPPIAQGAWPITLSIGVAELTAEDDPLGSSMAQRADAALYQAKEHGRDQVISLPPASDRHSPRRTG